MMEKWLFPILQIRKLGHRKVKKFAQSNNAIKAVEREFEPRQSAPSP